MILRTKMDLAIFWLPIIGTLLFGGIAVAAWYGGDKINAVWFGFAGCVCILLTVALQAQKYVLTVENQPKLELTPSEKPSFLRWDPPNSFQMQVHDVVNPQYGSWQVPKLRVRNLGQAAQDATIKWGVTPYDRGSLISSSQRLRDVGVELETNRITFRLKSAVGGGWEHEFAWSNSLEQPFITRDVETFIPLNVWQNAALYFIATMPDKPGAKSDPFYFDVEIRWNLPENGEPERYRVMAIAHDQKLSASGSPSFLAKIELSIVNED